ncbi:hypothetical protein L6452_21990 [Arctium lappa]|uniref:Uncharacterized protein n=1 Tax=Arctium lappa TaxID=4217 RepID=A0ACB9AYK3_ARCLA|nr:hypothetical protein L6452_21990 [Arctium lappa]
MRNHRNETVAENIVCGRIRGKPTEFSRSTNPVAYMNWIREIEQVFDACECEEGQKKKIMEEYCNERAMDSIEEKFRALKKGSLSARGKEERAVVGEKRRWESNPGPLKRPRSFNDGRSFDNRREARWFPRCRSKHYDNCNSNPTSCAKCGKNDHTTRDFLVKGLIYFECKMSGDFQKDYPKWKTGSTQEKKENPPRVPGRAFQMTAEETKASADVVSGMFLLNSVPARVLFDSGTSFSFVSNAFCHKLLMPTSNIEDALVVEITNNGQVVICDVLKCKTLKFGKSN